MCVSTWKIDTKENAELEEDIKSEKDKQKNSGWSAGGCYVDTVTECCTGRQ